MSLLARKAHTTHSATTSTQRRWILVDEKRTSVSSTGDCYYPAPIILAKLSTQFSLLLRRSPAEHDVHCQCTPERVLYCFAQASQRSPQRCRGMYVPNANLHRLALRSPSRTILLLFPCPVYRYGIFRQFLLDKALDVARTYSAGTSAGRGGVVAGSSDEGDEAIAAQDDEKLASARPGEGATEARDDVPPEGGSDDVAPPPLRIHFIRRRDLSEYRGYPMKTLCGNRQVSPGDSTSDRDQSVCVPLCDWSPPLRVIPRPA